MCQRKLSEEIFVYFLEPTCARLYYHSYKTEPSVQGVNKEGQSHNLSEVL